MGNVGIKQIRKVITANRGGLADATDDQIRTIWLSLDQETMDKYLAQITQSPDKPTSGKPEGKT